MTKWKPKGKETWFAWIRALQSVTLELTPWEQHFVASLNWQLDKVASMSQKQEEILERIYAERTK